MKLIFVRHGETEENRKRINQGQQGGILTELGIEQAKKLGERLKNEKIDKIYVSDLKRTVDTAKEIIKFHPNVPIVYDKRIREVCLGEFEGKPWGSVSEAAKKQGIPHSLLKPKQGESLFEMRQRVISFFEKVLEEEFDKTILFVTHGGPVRGLLIHLLNISKEEEFDFVLENTCVSIFEIDQEKNIKPIIVNCSKHLNQTI